MIQSMTGFGKTIVNIGNNSINIQVTSLNSKNIDIYTRIPFFLKEKEFELRSKLSQLLQRGKIELNISVDNFGGNSQQTINHELASFYKDEISQMCELLNVEKPVDIATTILKMPNVVKANEESITDEDWTLIFDGFNKAVEELKDWRFREGKLLAEDIKSRIEIISEGVKSIIPLEKERKTKIQSKILTDLKSLSTKIEIDKNRLEQELIYYLDRIDITEEIVRAGKHCNYFLEMIKSEESNGKKLAFISQEILRELNTMGVKANDAEIQQLVVEMKDEIEKVREQLFNIL